MSSKGLDKLTKFSETVTSVQTIYDDRNVYSKTRVLEDNFDLAKGANYNVCIQIDQRMGLNI